LRSGTSPGAAELLRELAQRGVEIQEFDDRRS
jgi:hypothetical protein